MSTRVYSSWQIRDGVVRRLGYATSPGILRLLIALAIYLAGCVHVHHASVLGPRVQADEEHCQALDRKVMALHLTGIIASSGSSGAATGAGIFDGDARYALAGTAAALGLTGAITAYLSTWFAAKYARECP